MKITENMRAGVVKRWHIVRTHRDQTIAEHMYRVWLLCVEMGTRMGMNRERLGKLEDMALNHDLPEVFTGDIPAPVKNWIKNNHSHVVAELEKTFTPAISFDSGSDPFLAHLLKMADLIEAICFLATEGIGQHAAEVKCGLVKELNSFCDKIQKDPRHSHEKMCQVLEIINEISYGI